MKLILSDGSTETHEGRAAIDLIVKDGARLDPNQEDPPFGFCC